MPNAQRQNRGVEEGSPKKNMGADGVTLEGLGSEKRKVGRSTGSPHKREVVVKGRLVDNSKDSVLQGRRSKNVESVDTV
ncbi:hypothetical protein V6N11_007917 [Hibiscus sabdariffa]|uniref:Uncharacterized protein n=1 Tax=Hibiscus sabdariffa TaxID=183260 RepID=A0ABR2PZ23_9ROSI